MRKLAQALPKAIKSGTTDDVPIQSNQQQQTGLCTGILF
jgi:hypothetical protein